MGSPPSDAFRIVPVRTLRQALRMRAVRNRVRQFLTHDQSQIGVVRQAGWFLREYRTGLRAGSIEAWLVTTGRGRAVGYGIVRWDRGRWWVTGALVPEGRGVGLGRRLFEFLTLDALSRGRGEAWLDVLDGNGRARRLYESLGYREVERSAGIVVMACRGMPRIRK